MTILKCTCATTTKSFGAYDKCYPCKINELSDQLEKAEKVAKFYADKVNWRAPMFDTKFHCTIVLEDVAGMLNEDLFGGKKAREYFREKETK